MTDLRTLVLRSASATSNDLAPFRAAPIPKLISDLDSVFGINSSQHHQCQGQQQQQSQGQRGLSHNNEFELTCALRFLSRCMVASDDATGRDHDAVQPRQDLLLPSSSSSSSSSDSSAQQQPDSTKIIVASAAFCAMAELLCRHVSQSSVGLVSIDGLQRLITVYGDGVISHNQGNNQGSSSAVSTALRTVIDAVFMELAVQELPTMSRRNALKMLQWFVNREAGWTLALQLCEEKLTSDSGEDSASAGAKQSTTGTAAASTSSSVSVSAFALWLTTLSTCLNEERDPVNVVVLFDVSARAHDVLIEYLARATSTNNNSNHNNAWPRSFAESLGAKILLPAQQQDRFIANNGGDQQQQEDVDDLLGSIENLFQVSAGYFPLQFQPAPGTAIKKETLVEKLHLVMSRPLFGAFALPLVLHKLQSATSTATMLCCLDVLQKCIARWNLNINNNNNSNNSTCCQEQGEQRQQQANNNTPFSLPLRQAVARRFLKDLFPFLRAFILHQAAAQSELVANRVISTLSDAAAAYDSAWPNGTSLTEVLAECATVSTLLQALPSSPNKNDTTSVVLDASLIHAVGRRAPLLAVVLATTVLPLIAGDKERIATTSALVANIEMNSAPTTTSSSCCQTASTAGPRPQLGDSNSDKANQLRSRVTLDDKATQTLRTAFRTAVETATTIMNNTSNDSVAADESSIRAAADTIASAACVRARNLLQFVVNGSGDETDSANFVDSAVNALLQRWSSTFNSSNTNIGTPTTTNNGKKQASAGLVAALGSSVGVCLCVDPAACRSVLSGDALAFVGAASAADSENAAAASSSSSFLRNAAATLHGVIAGPVSQFGGADAVDILTGAALQLRSACLRQANLDAVASVDRLCLSPLGEIIAAAPITTLSADRSAFVSRLRNHLVAVTTAMTQQDEDSSSSPVALAALAFVLELVFELFSIGATTTTTTTTASSSSAAAAADAADDATTTTSSAAVNLFDAVVAALASSNAPAPAAALSSSPILQEAASATSDASSASTSAQEASIFRGRIAAVVKMAFAAQQQQQQTTSSPLFSASTACNVLRLASIKNSQNAAQATTTPGTDSNNSINSDPNNITAAIQSLRSLTAAASTKSSRSTAAAADACLAEIQRAACLPNRNSAWRVQVATDVIGAILNEVSNSNSASSALHFCTVLAQQMKQQPAAFDAIVSAKFDGVLALLKRGLITGKNIITMAPDSPTAAASTDTAVASSSADDDEQQQQQDTVTWLEWFLAAADDAPRNAALDFIVKSDPQGTVLLALCDAAAANDTTATAAAAADHLQFRERALRILATVGKLCLDMSIDKDPRFPSLDLAVRPVLPVVLKRVQSLLGDKKRIVRAAAAETRHMWMLLPKN